MYTPLEKVGIFYYIANHFIESKIVILQRLKK